MRWLVGKGIVNTSRWDHRKLKSALAHVEVVIGNTRAKEGDEKEDVEQRLEAVNST